MMRTLRGQSLLEYTLLLVIIIAAFVTMQTYLKRGVQGRWKDSVDQLGDQYAPGLMNGVVTTKTSSTSESRLYVVPDTSGAAAGYYTLRTDLSHAEEKKTGSTQIEY